MSKIIFYRDLEDTFNCSVKIEGASLNESRARLLMDFGNKKLLFYGKISSDGVVTIPIQGLRDIKENAGTAVLEIIAEATFFEPWTSTFELKNKKQITVESVQLGKPIEKKVVVENVNKTKPLLLENAVDKRFISKYLPKYDTDFDSDLATYKPHKKILEWAKLNFNDISNPKAKFIMFIKEQKAKRR